MELHPISSEEHKAYWQICKAKTEVQEKLKDSAEHKSRFLRRKMELTTEGKIAVLEEQKRILNYLKSLLEVNPKASLAATIDLIETTDPERIS